MNDETTMTNQTQAGHQTGPTILRPLFGIRHCRFIRHSGFVIRHCPLASLPAKVIA